MVTMIEFVNTENNKSFIFDGDTLQEENNILRGTFIILFANKIIRITKDNVKNVSYEYPDYLFQDMNMCKAGNVVIRRDANDLEKRLYNIILDGRRLDDSLRKDLRQNYLNVFHIDNSENDNT